MIPQYNGAVQALSKWVPMYCTSIQLQLNHPHGMTYSKSETPLPKDKNERGIAAIHHPISLGHR
jgi:hypothetical protein